VAASGGCSASGAASVVETSPAPSATFHTVDSPPEPSPTTLCAHRGKNEVRKAQVAVLHTSRCEQRARTHVSSPSPSPSSSNGGCAANCSPCMLASPAGASSTSSPGSMELAEGAHTWFHFQVGTFPSRRTYACRAMTEPGSVDARPQRSVGQDAQGSSRGWITHVMRECACRPHCGGRGGYAPGGGNGMPGRKPGGGTAKASPCVSDNAV
jgi:hypothetical protein